MLKFKCSCFNLYIYSLSFLIAIYLVLLVFQYYNSIYIEFSVLTDVKSINW